MLTKSQVGKVLEVLAVGSMTVIGFAIGNPIVTEAIKGIGLNLASNLVQRGSTSLRENWFSSENGILNHDIQQAFVRGFVEAMRLLEKEYYRVRGTPGANELWMVQDLFQQLKEQAFEVFIVSDDFAISDDDLKNCLYGDEQTSQTVIWSRIEILLGGYIPYFRLFLRDNLLKTVLFCFGEELKKDTAEGKRAWRAFQRLLLEGIRADLKKLTENQQLILSDLQKLDLIADGVYEINEYIRRGIFDSLADDVKFIRENVGEINEKVDRLHTLVEKINPSPVFDENIFRQEYNDTYRRVMFAKSSYELNSVKHQIEYLEKKYPHQQEIFYLKDQFDRAFRYEAAQTMPESVGADYHTTMQSLPPMMDSSPKYSPKGLFLLIGIILVLGFIFLVGWFFFGG